jgi:hypothetical protein
MTESMEAFLGEKGAAQGLELQASGGRLVEGEAPQGEFVPSSAAVLAEVMEYMGRLHGASFVERVVADVVRSASPAEQAVASRLGVGVTAQATSRVDGD